MFPQTFEAVFIILHEPIVINVLTIRDRNNKLASSLENFCELAKDNEIIIGVLRESLFFKVNVVFETDVFNS